MNRKLLRAQPRGGQARAGMACLFLFPFDVFHHAEGPPVEVRATASHIRVYPPFPNEQDGQLEHVQVRLESVPRLPNTIAPHVQAPRLRNMRFRTNFGNNAVRGDAVRVDVIGSGTGPGDASWFVDRFLELARMLTLQWWILRDRRFDDTYLRNTFSINELGERLDGVAVQAMTAGQFKIERPLTRRMFEAAVDSAIAGKRSPISLMMACDSFYFFISRDMRRFIIEAAIACETVLTEHARHNARALGVTTGQIRQELDKAKFDDRLDKGCRRIFGRSFREDHPDAYAWLQALWVGRNNLAHGKPELIRYAGRTVAPGHTEYVGISDAVVTLFSWMTGFGAFRPVQV